jgi:hypothetical protein
VELNQKDVKQIGAKGALGLIADPYFAQRHNSVLQTYGIQSHTFKLLTSLVSFRKYKVEEILSC